MESNHVTSPYESNALPFCPITIFIKLICKFQEPAFAEWRFRKLKPSESMVEVVSEVLESNGLTIGNVLRRPIDGLIEFHVLN